MFDFLNICSPFYAPPTDSEDDNPSDSISYDYGSPINDSFLDILPEIEAGREVQCIFPEHNPSTILMSSYAYGADWFFLVFSSPNDDVIYDSSCGWRIVVTAGDDNQSVPTWDGSATGFDDGEGAVNIFCNNELIGSLSESGTAVLQTENTIVTKDIGIEYTKPEPQTLTIPLYTKVNLAEPVFLTNITGFPGANIDYNIEVPVGAVNFAAIQWDNSDSVAWWYDASTISDGYIEIAGYIPNEIPEGVTKVVILFS